MRALHFRRVPAQETGKAEGPHPEGAVEVARRDLRGERATTNPSESALDFAKERKE